MIFSSLQSAWDYNHNLLKNCPIVESRVGRCREIIGHHYVLTDPRNCWAGSRRKASLGYGFAELLWYLSGKDTLDMLGAYAPSYVNYTNDGRARGAYGYRWYNNPGVVIKGKEMSSLMAAVHLLTKNPDDRRCVVAMWDAGDIFEALRGEWKDIPCTLSLQFLVRDDRLHLIVTMRSNDHWMGGVYDPFTFCQLQLIVAAALKLMPGTYTHNVGSYHIYERNWSSLLIEPIGSYFDMPTEEEAKQLLFDFNNSPLAYAEETLRKTGEKIQLVDPWSYIALEHMAKHLEGKTK